MVIQINSVLLLFLFLFYFIFREVIEIKSVPIKRYHLRTSICQKPFKISAAVIPGCQRGLFRTTCWKTSLCCPVLCPADVCILSSVQADIRNNWGHTSHEPTLHLLSVGTDGRMRMCFFIFLFMDLISAQSVSVFFVLFPKLDVFLFICPSGFSPRSLSLVLDTFTTSWFISFYHLLTVNTVTGRLVLLLNDSGCVETHRRCLRWVDRGRNSGVMSLMISFSGRLVSKDNICTVQHMRENLFLCEFIMSWWFWLHLLSNVI